MAAPVTHAINCASSRSPAQASGAGTWMVRNRLVPKSKTGMAKMNQATVSGMAVVPR